MKKTVRQKNDVIKDLLKSVKAKQREIEIEEHNKPILYSNIVKSKKKYTRKKKHKKLFDNE